MSYRDQVIERNLALYSKVVAYIANRDYWLDRAFLQRRVGEDATYASAEADKYSLILREMRFVASLKHSARTVYDVWGIAEEDAISYRIKLETERRQGD